MLLVWKLAWLSELIASVNILVTMVLLFIVFSWFLIQIELVIDIGSGGIRFLQLALGCAICSLIFVDVMLVISHRPGTVPRIDLMFGLIRLTTPKQSLASSHLSLKAHDLVADLGRREVCVPHVIVELADSVLLQVQLHLFVDVLFVFLELRQDVVDDVVVAAHVVQLQT